MLTFNKSNNHIIATRFLGGSRAWSTGKLYCIVWPYTEGQLDRYHIGIPRENPKSALNLGKVRDL